MRIPLFHVNAFTNARFGGNPAAICLLDSWLDDASLGKVAAENNHSATAFLVPSREHYHLRWFTPRRELKLCGHATLAAGFVINQIVQPGKAKLCFSTRFHGTLTIERDENSFLMEFPSFSPEPCAPRPELWRALDLDPGSHQILEANETYIVVLENESEVHNFVPNFSLLKQLHPYVVCLTAQGQNSDFVSRFFTPSYGAPEDPVTGSVHCLLAPYWAERLDKFLLHARQLSERGGELWCQLKGDKVGLRGQAILTMRGALEI